MYDRGELRKRQENGKRRGDVKQESWNLVKRLWPRNRLLIFLEPEKYYSTIFFWNHETNEFLCYCINFQLPFQRRDDGIDTLDLDLDLVIHPDLSYEWKDVKDYQKAIEAEIISTKAVQGIEAAKQEILDRLDGRKYPFDGSWLD